MKMNSLKESRISSLIVLVSLILQQGFTVYSKSVALDDIPHLQLSLPNQRTQISPEQQQQQQQQQLLANQMQQKLLRNDLFEKQKSADQLHQQSFPGAQQLQQLEPEQQQLIQTQQQFIQQQQPVQNQQQYVGNAKTQAQFNYRDNDHYMPENTDYDTPFNGFTDSDDDYNYADYDAADQLETSSVNSEPGSTESDKIYEQNRLPNNLNGNINTNFNGDLKNLDNSEKDSSLTKYGATIDNDKIHNYHFDVQQTDDMGNNYAASQENVRGEKYGISTENNIDPFNAPDDIVEDSATNIISDSYQQHQLFGGDSETSVTRSSQQKRTPLSLPPQSSEQGIDSHNSPQSQESILHRSPHSTQSVRASPSQQSPPVQQSAESPMSQQSLQHGHLASDNSHLADNDHLLSDHSQGSEASMVSQKLVNVSGNSYNKLSSSVGSDISSVASAHDSNSNNHLSSASGPAAQVKATNAYNNSSNNNFNRYIYNVTRRPLSYSLQPLHHQSAYKSEDDNTQQPHTQQQQPHTQEPLHYQSAYKYEDDNMQQPHTQQQQPLGSRQQPPLLQQQPILQQQQPTELLGQPTGHLEQPIRQLGQPTRQLGQPSGQLGQPIGQLGQPIRQLGQPTGQLGLPTGQLGQPTGQLDQPTGQLGQPTVHLEQPIRLLGQPTGQLGQLSGQLGQPIGQLGQPIGQLGQPIRQLGQPTGQLGQSIEQLGQPTGQLGQPAGQLAQPIRQVGQSTGQLGQSTGQLGQGQLNQPIRQLEQPINQQGQTQVNQQQHLIPDQEPGAHNVPNISPAESETNADGQQHISSQDAAASNTSNNDDFDVGVDEKQPPIIVGKISEDAQPAAKEPSTVDALERDPSEYEGKAPPTQHLPLSHWSSYISLMSCCWTLLQFTPILS